MGFHSSFHEDDNGHDRREPGEQRPGEKVSLPDAKVYPPGYWESYESLKRQALALTAVRTVDLCIKRSGPMFAVRAYVIGEGMVEGPAFGDRLDALRAFIAERQ